MQNQKTLMGVGVIGAALIAPYCVTPILVILLGVVGLAALAGSLDHVLMPALVAFIVLLIYAVWRQQKADACCAPKGTEPGR